MHYMKQWQWSFYMIIIPGSLVCLSISSFFLIYLSKAGVFDDVLKGEGKGKGGGERDWLTSYLYLGQKKESRSCIWPGVFVRFGLFVTCFFLFFGILLPKYIDNSTQERGMGKSKWILLTFFKTKVFFRLSVGGKGRMDRPREVRCEMSYTFM